MLLGYLANSDDSVETFSVTDASGLNESLPIWVGSMDYNSLMQAQDTNAFIIYRSSVPQQMTALYVGSGAPTFIVLQAI